MEQGRRARRPPRGSPDGAPHPQARHRRLTASPPGALRRAQELAFLGRLLAAERLLAGAGDERARWLRAYIACARGELDEAIAAADPLAHAARDREIRLAASLTLGSALRQSGDHRAARRHDARALRLATTRTDRSLALSGLAADAVGEGDAGGAAVLVRRSAAMRRGAGWRANVRIDWVRCELALLRGQPLPAVRAARAALRASIEAGAARHVAKSLLFLGVSAREAGDDDTAPATLRDAAAEAERTGAALLARIAREQLRSLMAGGVSSSGR